MYICSMPQSHIGGWRAIYTTQHSSHENILVYVVHYCARVITSWILRKMCTETTMTRNHIVIIIHTIL